MSNCEMVTWLMERKRNAERQITLNDSVWDNGYWCGKRDGFDLAIAKIRANINKKVTSD